MKRAITLACLLGAGCASDHKVHTKALMLTGNDQRMVAILQPGQLLTTPAIKPLKPLIFRITDPNNPDVDFEVLLGTGPGDEVAAARGGMDPNHPGFYLDSGFALFWGVWPLPIDDVVDIGVDAVGVKSWKAGRMKLIFQHEGNTHRVFMIENPGGNVLKVRAQQDNNRTADLVTPGTFVEAKFVSDELGNTSWQMKKAAPSSPHQAELDHVLKLQGADRFTTRK